MVSNKEGEIQILPGSSAGRSSMRDTSYRASYNKQQPIFNMGMWRTW